ncbi:hypothetical protein, unlikely [Trypanosoma congolense IL3000]|uniref:Uncharacterized protein n=1 Tax=Trypanosoma congolense (strain IL3000) TaxID=1068625 RepID=F9W7R5_TRYCI|nr:hypothetical protein, unlikely [Trypanosoma congolense IL3000]
MHVCRPNSAANGCHSVAPQPKGGTVVGKNSHQMARSTAGLGLSPHFRNERAPGGLCWVRVEHSKKGPLKGKLLTEGEVFLKYAGSLRVAHDRILTVISKIELPHRGIKEWTKCLRQWGIP